MGGQLIGLQQAVVDGDNMVLPYSQKYWQDLNLAFGP